MLLLALVPTLVAVAIALLVATWRSWVVLALRLVLVWVHRRIKGGEQGRKPAGVWANREGERTRARWPGPTRRPPGRTCVLGAARRRKCDA